MKGNSAKTVGQSKVLQNKLQALYQTLNKEVIIAIRGEHEQHVKVKQGYLYVVTF